MLRIWDLVDGDLVERHLAGPEGFHCDALGLYWCIRQDPELGPTLRLARDAQGVELVPTPAEASAVPYRRARKTPLKGLLAPRPWGHPQVDAIRPGR